MVDKCCELIMKKITQYILFLVLIAASISCEDNIPRNRPTLSLENVSVSDDVIEVEEEDETIQRPTGAIIIQPNACACQGGEPISIGDCDAICAQKQSTGDQRKTFFFDVQLTEAITLDVYGDVAGWCSTLPGENITNQCLINIKDQDGDDLSPIAFNPAPDQLSFELDLSGEILNEDETYRISISEATSGATSTTIQLRLVSNLIDDTIGGPLALMPVNSYSCLFRDGEFDQNTGELIVNDVNRFHFYFIPETRPEPLTEATVPTVNCYDINTYGNTPINSPLLEETTGAFTVWNANDPRFFFLSGGTTRRVHELIEQNVMLQGLTLSQTPEIFFPLNWLNGFDDGDQAPGEQASVTISTTTAELGFYMAPFFDEETFRAYCPTREHYYQDSPLFEAMREIVGVDTEGLYVAKQQNVCDFILIKESLLKSIWFYIEGGQHIQPTEATVQGKQIQFYWPADPSSPFIKKSHQRTYTIRAADEVSCGSNSITDTGSSTSSADRTQVPPHDKRIGCIPVLGD